MNNKYEVVEYTDNLPLRVFFRTIDSFRLHWHEEMEILLVLKGSLHVLVQNVNHTLSKGELLVVSPNLIHATQASEEPNQVLVLQINCAKFGFHDAQITATLFDCDEGASRSPHTAALRRHICAVMLEMVYKQPGYRYTAASHVQAILGSLLRNFPSRQGATLEMMKGKERERIHRIFDYINTHYASRITLADLAEKEFLSVNHLSTFIHKTIGMGFSDYVNSVRLKAYLESLQSDMTTPIEDIAEKCGFSSPQYASALFQKAYKTTPGKYRRQTQQKSAVQGNARYNAASDAYLSLSQAADLTEVLRYWNGEPEPAEVESSAISQAESTAIDINRFIGSYHRSCLTITSIGRAYEGLLSHVQDTLCTLQREIGFTHLRFHGIFHDDMMVLMPDSSGSLHYSWRLVDRLLDFLLSIGLRPFFDLTYMPTPLASGPQCVFAWRGNITPPTSFSAWAALVDAFVRHCVSRYGSSEVDTWYFEVWSEPNLHGVGWAGTEHEYQRLYEVSARAIRRHCAARIIGPSVTAACAVNQRWIASFCDFCAKHDLPLSAISLHAYPELIDEDDLSPKPDAPPSRDRAIMPGFDMMGQDYVEVLLAAARRQMGGAKGLALVVSEWNLTVAVYSPINDSPFAATSMLKTALRCDAADVSLAHWTATDYIEEHGTLPPQEFHGGFGLITISGIRKATYWSLWALSRLRRTVVAHLPYGIATGDGDRFALLVYCHPKTDNAYDMAFVHDLSAGTLPAPDTRHYSVTLTGLVGTYRLRRYLFDPVRCDAKTLLKARGFAEPLSAEDARYLRELAQPILTETRLFVESTKKSADVSFCLRPCSFELIELIPEG